MITVMHWRKSSRAWVGMLAALLLAHIAAPASNGQGLRQTSSHYYTIQTNASARDVTTIAKHMDLIFAEYAKRFSIFGTQIKQRMPLYLFRTQNDYQRFLHKHGINGVGTGGMFFIRPRVRGLATWVEGRQRRITLETLQHEGFHQFAHACIGTSLPLWVNEGLAEYFGAGILTNSVFRIGIAGERRVEAIKIAIREKKTFGFDELLGMTAGRWQKNLLVKPRGRLQYDQSWSMVHFLIHGDDGIYRNAFNYYLKLVAKGTESRAAFATAFGAKDTRAFRRRWEKYAMSVQADQLDVAVSRMRFLAQGLELLKNRREPNPRTIDELRIRLEAIGFKAVRVENGLRMEAKADDPKLYQFVTDRGSRSNFQLLAPLDRASPPRITASGVHPQPVLQWRTDTAGKLMQMVAFE